MQYEQTRIYPRALELVRLSRSVIKNLPHGYGFISDQLKRASASVPLNFAEGYGKRSPRDARRYFDIARGSACEVAAIYDVAHTFEVIDTANYERGKDLADHLARMLTRFRR